MVYDLHAQKLAVKAIGTVESNLTYDSVNYNDPITVGVMQWYGTRAAALLVKIRDTNPSSWVGVAPSLDADLTDYAANNGPFWTTRYLTRTEGESLRPVLLANQGTQNQQAFDDLEDYKRAAERVGMDVDGNTQAVLFFFSMYHQGPKRALEVMNVAGAGASLDRVHSACLNNSVLGKYRTRYNTVKQIILANDVSGIDTPGTPTPPPEPGGDNVDGSGRLQGEIVYIETVGDQLLVHGVNGKQFMVPDGKGRYIAALDTNTGATVPPTPENPDPAVPPSAGVAAKQDAIVSFLTTKLDRYAYSQGPKRLKPESGMYTDCSALMHWAFDTVLGITIGTYTGAQYTQGSRVAAGSGNINLSLLQKGDLIFFNWSGGRNTVDHVEMFAGGSNMVGHGGPDPGPDIQAVQPAANRAINWYVQRFIT